MSRPGLLQASDRLALIAMEQLRVSLEQVRLKVRNLQTIAEPSLGRRDVTRGWIGLASSE
jgi:hypothetical protein